MQSKLGLELRTRHLFLPRNNHWLKRIVLVFAFIMFDYLSTLAFCRFPHEEANMYARVFMETLGIPLGLTLFVLMANLPIYMTLSLNSHLIKLPLRIALIVDPLADFAFAWFIAGLHFSGGTSWFWTAPDLVRQFTGTILYLGIIFISTKPLDYGAKISHG